MKKQIENFIMPVFTKLRIDSSNNIVSDSGRKELCDYQINTVFSVAKTFGKNPKEIGELIVEEINLLEDFDKYFKEVSFVMPGFINIKVSDELINIVLNKNINNNYGIEEVKKETFFIDYGGPNIAKPLHIGHLRPAIIGESIKRIINLKGYKTISDVHFGDFGLQMGEVIYGMLRDNKDLEEVDIDYLNKIYPEMNKLCNENEEILNECKKITKELQENDKYKEHLEKIIEVSLKDIKRLYEYLDISFDLWLGERDSFPFVKDLVKFLNEQGLVKLDDGAYIIDVSKETDTKEIPPFILLKNDGATLYSTTDLATIYDRVNKYTIDHMLYVVDARQEMHFEQVFRVCDKSKLFPYNKLEHIKFGTINGSDNKPFKTRSGDVLKLDDLIKETKETFISKKEDNKNMSDENLDKIVNAILKYADLSNSRDKNYIFDLSKFSDVNGKTGPYILYTALRIRKLLKDNQYEKSEIKSDIYNINDRDLRIKLTEFDKYLTLAVNNRMPHYICEYLFELCNLINNFYQNNNLKNETDNSKKNNLLNILDYSYKLIEEALSTLIIELPEIM